MSFANPLALALFALFIPVILLYLLKQRRKHVQVSSLLFWDKILRDEHTVTSLTRLRKLLSLLLQLLIISLLALALARPTFSKDLLGARRLVVLLDVSASMTAVESGKTRFDAAVEQVREAIQSMAQGDSAMLVAVGAQADVVSPFTDSRKGLLERVQTIRVSHGLANWVAAFELLGHLPPDPRETHVYVASDGAFDAVTFNAPEKMKFGFLNAGEAKDNVGVTAFQVRPLQGSPRDFEIFFEVTNSSGEEKRVPFEVRVADALVDAGEFLLAANASEIRTLKQISTEGGEIQVVLDSPDAFQLDNRAFAVLPSPEAITVLLVTENNLFLESALGTDDGIALETVTPGNYAARTGAAPQVTVFDRWTPETTPAGNAIFLAAWASDFGLQNSGDLADAIVTDWQQDHAVNQHVSLKNITVPKAQKVAAADGFEVLVRSFDDPLVLLRQTPADQQLAIAFDASETDLPLRVAYPILVSNSIRYLAGIKKDSDWQSPPIGRILTATDLEAFQQRQGHHAQEAIARVALPGDGTVPIAYAADMLVPIERAGVYFGETVDGERFPLFAANVNNRRESSIAPAEALPITSEKPIAMIERSVRFISEPWLALAALAFTIVCAEWWLFHRRIVE